MLGGFVNVRVIGDKALKRALEELPMNAQKRVMRKAVTYALTPMNTAAKRFAPVETGLLKRSIGKKVKQYRTKGVTWGGVGARKGFGVSVEKGGSAEIKIGKKRVVVTKSKDPVFYAIPVELGHGGKVGSRFLTRAYESTRDVMMRRLADNVEQGITREAMKLAPGIGILKTPF